MSKYTTQIRWIVEQATIENKNLPISQRINLALPKIFDFEYPIWLPDYKSTLERKIIMHYFNKEIGLETVGLWKFYLEEKLNLIMPYYNKLYETTVKDYDYLSDTNAVEIYEANKYSDENGSQSLTGNTTNADTENFEGTGTNNMRSTKSQTVRNLDSDLPQANYANLDYGTKLEEGEQNNTGEDNTTISNNSNSRKNGSADITQKNTIANKINVADDFNRTRKGAWGSRSLTEMLMLYRESLINIDREIINELSDLFMMIY